MPSDLDIRLALLINRILHKVIVYPYLVLCVESDDCTAAVQEGPKTLPSSDFKTFFDSRVVSDTAHQHGADSNDRHVVAGWTFYYHDRSAIFAENVKSA